MIKALWIDDDAESEKMVSRCELLLDMGIAIDPCADLVRAKNLIAAKPLQYDVILIDLVMPPGDLYTLNETSGGTLTGLCVIKDIRKIHMRVPIIVVSIRRSGTLVDLLSELRSAEYVEKPYSTQDLAAAVFDAIKQ